MIQQFNNGIQLELSGSLIQIKKNGMTIKAYEVGPLNAIERFNELAIQIKKIEKASAL
jgi:hypothetical protein